MSTPLHPHLLRREIERGSGGAYVPARFAQMRCDGFMGQCPTPPIRAPRLVVPPEPWRINGPKPLRMMTTLHYCQRHTRECTVDILLTDKVKANFEQVARARWSHGLRPDFAAAALEWMLVTTPEYRAFLEQIEVQRGAPTFGGIPLL